jgi:DNA-directed RNA polymerase specialized sigma24 family protein
VHFSSIAEREKFWRDLIFHFDRRLRAYLRCGRWSDQEVEELLWEVWSMAVEVEDTLAASRDRWPVLRELAARASSRLLRVRRRERLSRCWADDGTVLDVWQLVDAELDSVETEPLRIWTAAVLMQLSEQQRLAVDYRYRWGWPYWAVAAAIDIAEPTARVHASRGLERLRKIAERCPPPC